MLKTAIINPVGSNCNLRCDYCFQLPYIRNSDIDVMPDKILEQLIKTSLAATKDITYLFHGGEPLLAGRKFYEKVIKYQKDYRNGHSIRNHIQTNGTLIDKKWVNFFKKFNFTVSTSIDGPQYLHDLHRKDSNGDGTFQKVFQSISMMNEVGLPVGLVVTINKDNVHYPREIYNFLINQNQLNGFEINPCSPTEEGNPLVPKNKDLANFLIKIFDMWWKDDNPNIYIRIFENLLRVLIDDKPNDCSFSFKACRQFIAIDINGDAYPCERFVHTNDGYFGNIMENGINTIIKKDKTKEIYEKMAWIPKCQDCKWLRACGGGCAHQRWLNGGWGSKYYLCGVRKKLFSHIEQKAKMIV